MPRGAGGRFIRPDVAAAQVEWNLEVSPGGEKARDKKREAALFRRLPLFAYGSVDCVD
ncbi:MAG: hypothetical protein LC795_22895 [Acidobacteria bacterium]|nr:hypothetical protein [Acidobacteriota bacterium]